MISTLNKAAYLQDKKMVEKIACQIIIRKKINSELFTDYLLHFTLEQKIMKTLITYEQKTTMNFKKTSYLFLAFLIGFSITASAQSSIGLGLRAGVNLANLSGGPYDLDSRTGLLAGAVLEYQTDAIPLEFEAGLYYSQKGAEGQYKETIIKGAYEGNAGTFKLDYIEIPVLAKYRFQMEGSLSPYLMAGPYLELNIGSEVKASKNVAYLEDISDEIRSSGFGVIFGAGSDLQLNGRRFNVQARYGLGITPVFEERSDEGEKHSVISLTAGFRF